MFVASLLRRIAFSYYDYKAYNFNIEKTDFVVIHIPDQIGDAMAIFPVIRALELHKIKHLLIVTSTINLEVNRPGFPGECFICELRLPDHRFRWKHNKLFLLLPEEYGPAFPAIVDCYTSPPT
ncbi:hypothetical protein JNE110611_2529 [Escherichia coli]|nr:hypothetical protein JNE072951_2478 [Escherichia coli]BDQ76890.1 hypothetical protein JNE110611_2529 [Escherichia coli]BDQ82085.1 hypothetical protein PV0671_2396 [Escherichia coli]BDQ87516.1 hypothetical protein JNE071324_2569 [Escherichia coli]BDQ92942.1 hypothetical protein PV0197_2520 [Escherichia coli]